MTKDDYFIVDKNWVDVIGDWNNDFFNDSIDEYRYGVIDINGNIIIPFTYYYVNELVLKPARNEPNNEKLLFYAHEYSKLNGKIVLDSGYLYSPNGKKASSYRYDWVRLYQGDRIVAKRTDTGYCGIMDPNMNNVVTFRYLDIVVFDDWLAAVKKKEDGTFWIDFLDENCKSMGWLQVGSDEIEVLDRDLLMAKGLNGKYGFIDKSMTWCADPKWDSHAVDESWDEYYGPGFVMKIGKKMVNVNKYGKTFIPKGSIPENCDFLGTFDGHMLFYDETRDENGNFIKSIVFDDTGKVLYKPKSMFYRFREDLSDGIIIDGSDIYDIKAGKIIYSSKCNDYELSYENGVVIDGGRAYNLSGKELAPGINNISKWDTVNGLIVCNYNDNINITSATTIYTMDGVKLPLPENASIECISKNLFIVQLRDNSTGVCNDEGKWIAQPSNYYVDTYSWPGWPIFSLTVDDSSRLYGAYSPSGRIVYDAIFTYLEPLNTQYFEVYYKGVHGVVDSNGNWIWYANEYDTLED